MHEPNIEILTLPVKALCIHPTAQRKLVAAQLRKMHPLNLDGIGTIHVVRYGGATRYMVVDGQHRVVRLIQEGYDDLPVTVMFHRDIKTDAEASGLFLALNKKANVSTYATFDQEVRAGFEPAVSISNLVHRRGLKITQAAGNGRITCVCALRKLYGSGSSDNLLGVTLDIVIEAWGKTDAAVEGDLLAGIGIVFATYSDLIDKPALVKKLAKYPGGASKVIGNARGIYDFRGSSMAACVAEVVVSCYNTSRRSGKLVPLQDAA
jgi:hypothetical protein